LLDKTYYIETYGCQMNDHDSEKMAAMLESQGFFEVFSAEDAHVIIVNTCSIREKAEMKVYSSLGRFRSLKQQNPEIITVVAGCVAQQEKRKLLRRVDHLDAVIGTHQISQLPEIIDHISRTRSKVLRVDLCDDADSLHMPAPLRGPSRVTSYVTIMQGCSNFCSYCVVPFTRGPEQSRRLAEIVDEVERLVSVGIKEVTLLGQNVNAYGKDLDSDESFVGLLERLDAIEGLKRIRFTTSHPRDFNEQTVAAMARLEKVCEHIHLPLQSASNKILAQMRRGYTYEQYLEKIRSLRSKIPGTAITTDFIIGFPGETDADFEQTLRALEEIRYDQIFSFKYSRRPQTAAREFLDQVPEDVKIARLKLVHEIQERITDDYHRAAEGTSQEVLIEGTREHLKQAFGRTRTNKIVNVGLDEDAGIACGAGDVVKARILRGLKHSLLAEPA
jgi:tRNA-2-methylthio-N6-dimethylallyladenosine synthase